MYPSINKETSAPFPDDPAPPKPAIGIPLNSADQFNHPPPPPPNNYSNVVSQSPVRWSTGLCGCCEDYESCCLTFWCPCVTFGRVAEIVDRGSTSCGTSGALYTLILCILGCPCIYSCFYRSKMRGLYNLEGGTCTDFCIHCCCEECALCQEYRELNNRGFDMSLGWHGNIERNNHLAPPTVQGGMTR